MFESFYLLERLYSLVNVTVLNCHKSYSRLKNSFGIRIENSFGIRIEMTSEKMTQVEEEMSDENSTELNDNDVMKRFNQELESVSPA